MSDPITIESITQAAYEAIDTIERRSTASVTFRQNIRQGLVRDLTTLATVFNDAVSEVLRALPDSDQQWPRERAPMVEIGALVCDRPGEIPCLDIRGVRGDLVCRVLPKLNRTYVLCDGDVEATCSYSDLPTAFGGLIARRHPRVCRAKQAEEAADADNVLPS